MDGEALAELIDNDRLGARSEEAVWEAVVEWMRGKSGDSSPLPGWRGVVGMIRFPLMREEYLENVAEQVAGMVGGEPEDGEWLADMVAEAMLAKAARREGTGFECELLGRKALVDRVGLGVRWEEHTEGGELRLAGHDGNVKAIAACGGRVFSGSTDGSIRVWSRASRQHEKTMWANAAAEEEEDDFQASEVLCLAVWEGRLMSGHSCGALRVWNVETGESDVVVGRHDDEVLALAVCGSRLVSGGMGGHIKAWSLGAGGHGPVCEWTRLLRVHGRNNLTNDVYSLAGWPGKVLSGSHDASIRVWDVGTGEHEATLVGHTCTVNAMVVHRDRLLSSSYDMTIREWAVGTWTALRTVMVDDGGEMYECARCLAVSGSKLISGAGAQREGQRVLRVWGLEELDCQQVLPQPGSEDVRALVALDGEVWGAVGKEVVVWGREV
jgi:WD40 repeat protein